MLQLKQKPLKGGLHAREDIAKNQNLSLAYMDRVLACLQKEKLIRSQRGKNGGFLLAKEARLISLWDIFSSVEDKIYPVKCLGPEHCVLEDTCLSKKTWFLVYDNFVESLQKKNLAELPQSKIALKERPKKAEKDDQTTTNSFICPAS